MRSRVYRLIVVLVLRGECYDYCSLSRDHLLCPGAQVSTSCGNIVSSGVTSSDIATIVSTHNRLRSAVAMGQTSQPPASNMRMLTWDPELAAVAQVGLGSTYMDMICSYIQCRPTQTVASLSMTVLNVGECRGGL